LDLEPHYQWYSRLLVILLVGFLFFDRAFAHLHIPGTPIYLAEFVLTLGIVLAVYSVEGRRLIRMSTPIRALAGFMAWGVVLLFFGVFSRGLDAVQDSALWYYGLFALVVGAMVLALLTPLPWPALPSWGGCGSRCIRTRAAICPIRSFPGPHTGPAISPFTPPSDSLSWC
jgi:hypothetical protein